MKPLADLPDRDGGSDPSANRAVWSLVFIGLAVFLLANLPPEQAGWFIIFAGVSASVGAWFLFLLLVRRND